MTTSQYTIEELQGFLSKLNEYVCQELGKALGYPWFKDNLDNFPGSTEEHGVCVGEHVAESICDEAAKRINTQRDTINKLITSNERQVRMIEAIKEARDRWQAKAETLEQEIAILKTEVYQAVMVERGIE